jgi:hypothetical protein
MEQFVIDQVLRLTESGGSKDGQPARGESLSPADCVALVDQLIERVVYDGRQERISISFRDERVAARVDHPARPRKVAP